MTANGQTNTEVARLSNERAIVPAVVDQHAEELNVLCGNRRVLTRSAHIALRHLARVDQRILAHHDGCAVAGSHGLERLSAQLADAQGASVFAVAFVALTLQERAVLHRCLALVAANAGGLSGMIAAVSWASAPRLAGIGRDLLLSQEAFHRRLGIAACRVHSVDPGQMLLAGLRDPDAGVRAEALRTAGVLGKQDAVSMCADALRDDHPDVQFWAQWSAVLLGNRGVALDALARSGETPGAHRARAFRLSLQAMKMSGAHRVLQDLATDPKQIRWLIQGAGITGDPTYVPWLIGHMENNETTRLAGEAFSLITGLDLALLDLDRKPPEDFESGPNDDPDDPNVAMDEDDGLPWPDPQRIQHWWDKNGSRFSPGTRYFMGAPVTREHCIDVLKNGYQRQRILAAHYLCLLEPGTPLFNTSAPAWRQQRLLAKMT